MSYATGDYFLQIKDFVSLQMISRRGEIKAGKKNKTKQRREVTNKVTLKDKFSLVPLHFPSKRSYYPLSSSVAFNFL